MIKCNVKGYTPSCSAIVGGVGTLYVGDANDFDFTPGAPDANGDATGYATVALRPIAGSGATGTAVLTADAVTSVNVTAGGTGYTTAPNVVFSGGGGTGAAGTAVISGGVVTGVTITNGGTGYTTAPTVAFVVPASSGQKLFEITSVIDSLSVDVSQSNPESTSSEYAYEIKAKAARFGQSLAVFANKIDAASVCCDLIFVWVNNDGTIQVAGEKYVNSLKVPAFRFKQDGSKFSTGAKFSAFNGGDLLFKGTYFRLPYEFTGGMGALAPFIAQ